MANRVVPARGPMYLHLPNFTPNARAGVPATLHRAINVSHVRHIEYNRLTRVLNVEFANGEARTFLNIDASVLAVFPDVSKMSAVVPPEWQVPYGP